VVFSYYSTLVMALTLTCLFLLFLNICVVSCLLQADERAVLKHFKWPERKADAMREAAIEYRELKLLETEISSYQDDTNIPCEAALKKMASLLDK
jgi:hypothetical protein